jgi:hypothetical protein
VEFAAVRVGLPVVITAFKHTPYLHPQHLLGIAFLPWLYVSRVAFAAVRVGLPVVITAFKHAP